MKKRFLSILVIVALCIGCMPVYVHANSADPVEAFVARLYMNILQREADPEGLSSWTNVLKTGKESGGQNYKYCRQHS